MKFSVQRLASLSSLLRDSQFIQTISGPKNEILVLTKHRKHGYAVHELMGDRWQMKLSLPSTTLQYAFVQPMPDENFLLVERRLPPKSSQNAHIFDRTGKEVSAFTAGDGIEHVQTTSNGEIWVGFFDEGVYGMSEPAGIGAAGLVCLDARGEVLFRYADQVAEPQGLPPIDDCYALNVLSQSEVWLSYYGEFPVVALSDKTLKKAWVDFPLRAAKAFAVSGDNLLMLSAYKNPRWLQVDLENRVITEAPIADENGLLIELDFCFARGPVVYFGAKGRDELYSATLLS